MTTQRQQTVACSQPHRPAARLRGRGTIQCDNTRHVCPRHGRGGALVVPAGTSSTPPGCVAGPARATRRDLRDSAPSPTPAAHIPAPTTKRPWKPCVPTANQLGPGLRHHHTAHARAGAGGGDGLKRDTSSRRNQSTDSAGVQGREGLAAAPAGGPLPVVVPIVLDEEAVGSGQRPGPGAAEVEATPPGPVPGQSPPPPSASTRWPALVLLPAAVWGLAWASTVGLVSAGYAALASAAAIAATTFSGLTPGAAAAAAVPAGAGGAGAAAAAVAAVDWTDVALRTAAGLTADDGGAGRAQVLAALQEAGAGRAASWAVVVLLPVLTALAGGCGAAASAVRTGLPWLGPVALLAAAAAGLGVLLLLAAPLRPYLAPLLPLLPRGRLSPAALAALRAGGAVCMVAVLTALQTQELTPPPLVPSVRGAAAAAALSSPLLLQTQAVMYGMAAAVGDAVLPACAAVVAARAMGQLLRQLPVASASTDMEASGGAATAAAKPTAERGGRGSATFGAVRALAAGRLLLDVLLLLAVAAGALPGKISAMRLLGMLWLLQTAAQL